MVTPVILTLVLAGQVSALWAVPWFAWQAGKPTAGPHTPQEPA
jgi:hypothetical protein